MSDNQGSILNQKMREIPNMEKRYSSPVITIKPESSIFDALLQMQTNFVKHIVIAVKNIPVGIVTERDINRFLGEDKTAHGRSFCSMCCKNGNFQNWFSCNCQ